MRIKTYIAASMEKAMNQVRLEMGAEAIILSSQKTETGEVQLTAAVERKALPIAEPKRHWTSNWDEDWKTEATRPEPDPAQKAPAQSSTQPTSSTAPRKAPATPSPKLEKLVESMAYHGIPTELAEKLCRLALSIETDDPTISLAAALDNRFRYSSRFAAGKRPVMLVGAPGVGKTVTLSKFAATAKLEGRKVQLISTDTTRPGAIEQLQSYADILEFDLHVAPTAEELGSVLAKPELQDGSEIMIDTAGVNVYDDDELANLTKLIVAAKAEPVAVIAAGTDTAEMSEMASRFGAIGAKRLIATRLDTTRRYGSLFTAADTANMSFSFASVSSSVATGLHTITPVNLARLLLRDPTKTGISKEFIKVTA